MQHAVRGGDQQPDPVPGQAARFRRGAGRPPHDGHWDTAGSLRSAAR